MKTLICFLVVQFFLGESAYREYSTYKAAVVEYAPIPLSNRPVENLNKNVRNYINFISKAAKLGAQIIVFPEDGLTWKLEDKLLQENVSTEVPNAYEGSSPCGDKYYPQFFRDLSCAAKNNSIFVVVNLMEQRRRKDLGKKVFHSTSVAFDRNGVVIARYRIINSLTEPFYDGPTVYFKSDFNVTFGLFTSYDILHKNPAKHVLIYSSVTDIAYPTRWVSKTPFYEALSVQHGYAKSNAVNLLAAGLHSPENGNGGSGIYFHDGLVADAYILGTGGSKLMVQDVPIIERRDQVAKLRQLASFLPEVNGTNTKSNFSLFSTTRANLQNYTFRDLNLSKPEILETICNGQSGFCCSFNITMDKYAQPNYVYKLVAFYGTTLTFGNTALGEANCALVACLNENNDSCGGRLQEPPSGVRFSHIVLTGKFNAKNSHYQPATLTFDLLPMGLYVFSRNTVGEEVEIQMQTAKSLDSLLTFGIMGRVFDHDGNPAGTINDGSFHIANVVSEVCGKPKVKKYYVAQNVLI